MTRDPARRAALIERLTDHVLAQGLSSSSLRPLAAAAGTSDRMLLYYFRDKTELIGAVLENVAARMVVALTARIAPEPLPFDTLCAHLSAVLLADEFWPYMQLWLEIASLAARGDPVMLMVGEQIGRGFLAWGAVQLAGPPDTRDADSARLLVTIEGLVLLKSIGMADVGQLAI